ncbi:MAG: F0F1 ATP synthase subunit A [Muribaculaceae bacterium]|nr:F0F1 ATP synthase subunit A [Muribaculaceae bacterium]
MVLGLANYYKKRDLRAPRKGMGFFELLVSFIYYDNIKPTLGDKAAKFAPYLLTCFFFILTMNLVGLIVIFPGGANLTGNIAITLVLALCTFIVTNVLGTKHYWKEIFWPDVPIWLKCPLPIMQLIEVFGIFTKPAALCVRLFANMMGGHMIVITLTLLIFILAAFGPAVMGGATVVSVLFSIFMLLLDVLVSFIQAYVFTLLSTLFIASAQESHDEHEAHVHADGESHAEAESELNKEKVLLSKEAAAVDFK